MDSGDERGRPHDLLDLGGTGVLGVLGPAGEVFQVHDADDVVDVLADHRDARVAAAQGQGQALGHGLVALDPDHFGARDHDLAGDGVAEFEDGLDHVALTVFDDAPRLGHVDQFAQLDLGGERALTEAAPGRHRVAQHDEQRGQRAEERAEDAHHAGTGQRHPVGMLAPESARTHPDQDVGDHDHDQHGQHRHVPTGADSGPREDGDEHGRREFGRHPEQ